MRTSFPTTSGLNPDRTSVFPRTCCDLLRRYYIWAERLELALGSTPCRRSRLGRLRADERVGPDPASGMLPGADEFSRARLSYQH
jgi:hypothetical protein